MQNSFYRYNEAREEASYQSHGPVKDGAKYEIILLGVWVPSDWKHFEITCGLLWVPTSSLLCATSHCRSAHPVETYFLFTYFQEDPLKTSIITVKIPGWFFSPWGALYLYPTYPDTIQSTPAKRKCHIVLNCYLGNRPFFSGASLMGMVRKNHLIGYYHCNGLPLKMILNPPRKVFLFQTN